MQCWYFVSSGRKGVGTMRKVTCVLQQYYIYNNLISVRTQFCMDSMLEYVACRQFWGASANMCDTTHNLRHFGNMVATYVAEDQCLNPLDGVVLYVRCYETYTVRLAPTLMIRCLISSIFYDLEPSFKLLGHCRKFQKVCP